MSFAPLKWYLGKTTSIFTGLKKLEWSDSPIFLAQVRQPMAQQDPFGLVGLTYDDVLLLPGESDVVPSLSLIHI